jgi:hypothetical protein
VLGHFWYRGAYPYSRVRTVDTGSLCHEGESFESAQVDRAFNRNNEHVMEVAKARRGNARLCCGHAKTGAARPPKSKQRCKYA